MHGRFCGFGLVLNLFFWFTFNIDLVILAKLYFYKLNHHQYEIILLYTICLLFDEYNLCARHSKVEGYGNRKIPATK
jgi:hypothetical protein